MSIESLSDLDGITAAGQVVAETLQAIAGSVRAGIATAELDGIGRDVLDRYGARSAPKMVYGCPTDNLISINDEIVHGLPSIRELQLGDVVKIDVTAELNGYIADSCVTVIVEPGSDVAHALQQCAVDAFEAGLLAARAGRPVSDIGKAVEHVVTTRGFHVIRSLSGHGVGRTIHEHPTVPNYYDKSQRDVLKEGMVLTIEPLISERPTRVIEAKDGWTLRTSNKCLAVHHEHTIVITSGSAVIITSRSARNNLLWMPSRNSKLVSRLA